MADIRGLYAIVDGSYADPPDIARRILDGGCRIIQLRCKNISSSVFLEMACDIGNECSRYGALFIVNDRVDIALLCGAAGIHLGQEDLPLCDARKIMGKEKIIGISTHNMEEALAARDGGADYIGFGPLFKTGTKMDAHSPKGIEALKNLEKNLSIPIVAIGGIVEENIPELYDAGADAVAMISGLARSGDIRAKAGEIVELIEKCNER